MNSEEFPTNSSVREKRMSRDRHTKSSDRSEKPIVKRDLSSRRSASRENKSISRGNVTFLDF